MTPEQIEQLLDALESTDPVVRVQARATLVGVLATHPPEGTAARTAFDLGRRIAGIENRWQRARRAFLRLHPVCSVPGCESRSIAIVVDRDAPFDRSRWQLRCEAHGEIVVPAEPPIDD